jgi:RNA polymerase sigma-54 factor
LDEVQELALTIVDKHLELLAARDFAKIRRLTGCDDEELKARTA